MKRKFALLIVILSTLGIIFTLIYHVLDNPTTMLASGLGIFKYFTILSNLVVTVYFWLLFSLKQDKYEKFNKLLGGVTIYITVTGLVFVFILQSGFHQVGLDLLGSILCHYIIPILTVAFLIIYRKDYHFKFKDILVWMIFPLAYIGFVLIRGAFTSNYIYPFLELDSLGAVKFLLNVFALLFFFIALSIILVFLTRQKK
ncbi:MAG: Pr6Pr family membrane protein [Tenericutes bacterium]|nr:Pr6Pr family membrane protein [Mycoplasmatota bacterium]